MNAIGKLERYAKRVFQGFSIGTGAALMVYAFAVSLNRQNQLGLFLEQDFRDVAWPFLLGPVVPCIQLITLCAWFAYLAHGERIIKQRLSVYTAAAGVLFSLSAGLSLVVAFGAADAVFLGDSMDSVLLTDYFDIQSIMIALMLFALALVFRRVYALQEDNDSIL